MFGSIAPDGVSLDEHLGAAKDQIDLFVDLSPEGKLDVRSGVSKYSYPGNWKLQVENAIDAGATIINDVWGLTRSPGLADLAARHECALVLMHNQQGHEYGDLLAEVAARLGRTPAAVAGLLQRGLKTLRALLHPKE